jgi:hypothetical protein
MIALSPRRWHASKAAAERDAIDEIRVEVAGVDSCYRMYFYGVGGDGIGHWYVTGRSASHVDRLARDWIAHGVAPTEAGGRGVRRPDWPERTPWGWRQVTSRHVLRRFDRAERRAARVVSR